MSTRTSQRVAVIGGDGIGPEVTAEALKVVAAAGVQLETTDFELGAAHYLASGDVLPDATLEELRGFDAILLGAVGPPVGSTEVPNGLLERGLLLRLRFELDLYVNLRPFTGTPGYSAATSFAARCQRSPAKVRTFVLWTRVSCCRGRPAASSKAKRRQRSTPIRVFTDPWVATSYGVPFRRKPPSPA